MKILVIPDVHLKPEMFKRASAILKKGHADRAVCLMDIADDWNREYDVDLYTKTYDTAIAFAKKYPETFWCYGNHDLSYVWMEMESGFSSMMLPTVSRKMYELKERVGERIAYIHRVDDYLFMHGGLLMEFVWKYVPKEDQDDVDRVISFINGLGKEEIWQDTSPVWSRPQYYEEDMYGADTFTQVVGHTPVEKIYKKGNVISCDVFSTRGDGSPIGTQEFLIIDTETDEYISVK